MENSINSEKKAAFYGLAKSNVVTKVGGVWTLGTSGVDNVVWSTLRNCKEQLSPRNMTKPMLLAVCGKDWALEHFPKINEKSFNVSVDVEALSSYINDGCVMAGPFTEDRERAAGIWPSADGQLVINSSSGVWRSDGQPVERANHEGYTYTLVGSYDLTPDTPPATPEEVAEYESFLGCWEWRHTSEPMLMMAWSGTAMVSAANGCRPHIYVGGPKGIGKTQCVNVVSDILGEGCLSIDGDSNEAGVRQALNGSPLAVLIDESENTNRRAQKRLTVLARTSYSDNGDGVLRGTAGGKAKRYALRSAFLRAAINTPALDPADESRSVQVELVALKDEAKLTPHRLIRDEAYRLELGRRIRRLVVNRWSVLRDSFEVFRKIIIESTGNSRMAATIGTLLAGYWCLKNDVVVNELDAELMFNSLELNRHAEAQSASDEQNCFETIQTAKGRFTSADSAGNISKAEMTIGQAIRKVVLRDRCANEISAELQNLGLRTFRQGDAWYLGVVKSQHFQGIRQLFRGTPWDAGGWTKPLLRIEGAYEDQQRVGSLGSKKMVMVPLSSELLIAEVTPSFSASAANEEWAKRGAGEL